MTRWAFALLATALLGLAGCTNSSTGSPLPTSSTEDGQTVSSGPSTSTENAAVKLAAIDPCSLLTQAQLDQHGLRKQSSGNVAGARDCAWNRRVDENGKGGFTVGPAIWDHQGLKDINTDGQIVTDTPTIGKHQARQAKQANGDACFVAIGVTDSSRVDVVASGDPGQGCVLANQFAKLIEPQLPGGS